MKLLRLQFRKLGTCFVTLNHLPSTSKTNQVSIDLRVIAIQVPVSRSLSNI